MPIEIPAGKSIPPRHAMRESRVHVASSGETDPQPSVVTQSAGLLQSIQTQPEVFDTARVEALRAAIQEGRYEIDNERLAQAILAHVI